MKDMIKYLFLLITRTKVLKNTLKSYNQLVKNIVTSLIGDNFSTINLILY